MFLSADKGLKKVQGMLTKPLLSAIRRPPSYLSLN